MQRLFDACEDQGLNPTLMAVDEVARAKGGSRAVPSERIWSSSRTSTLALARVGLAHGPADASGRQGGRDFARGARRTEWRDFSPPSPMISRQ